MIITNIAAQNFFKTKVKGQLFVRGSQQVCTLVLADGVWAREVALGRVINIIELRFPEAESAHGILRVVQYGAIGEHNPIVCASNSHCRVRALNARLSFWIAPLPE